MESIRIRKQGRGCFNGSRRVEFYEVIADTKRFGKAAIMFQGDHAGCLKYLKDNGVEYVPQRSRCGAKITRKPDRWNPRKVWIIKRYADGHFGLNQEIAGRLLYTSFTRTTKAKVDAIFACC